MWRRGRCASFGGQARSAGSGFLPCCVDRQVAIFEEARERIRALEAGRGEPAFTHALSSRHCSGGSIVSCTSAWCECRSTELPF